MGRVWRTVGAALMGLALMTASAHADLARSLAPLVERFEAADTAGDDAAGIVAGEAALAAIRRARAAWDERLLDLLHQLSRAHYRQGSHARAETLAREAHSRRGQHFGHDDPRTLDSAFDLGAALIALGRYAEAEVLLRGTARLRRARQGPREVGTQDAMDLHASALRLLGRLEEAEALYREVLALRRDVFGPRHNTAMVTLNNLGLVLYELGRPEEAVPALREALAISIGIHGRRSHHSLMVISNLGAALKLAGDLAEAVAAQREAVELARALLGPRHRVSIVAMNNLGNLLAAAGREGEAERMLREALRLHREVQGPTHPETLVTANNLAALYQLQNRHAEAEPLLREAHAAHREALGADHPETLRMLDNLAVALHALDRMEEAERAFREVLARRRVVLGQRHPDTATSLNNLATLLRDSRRLAEAETMLRDAESIVSAVLGSRHPDALQLRNNLAALLGASGRGEEAAAIYRETRLAAEEALGPQHARTLTLQLNEAGNLAGLGRMPEATALLRAAGEARLGRLGTELHANETAAARRALLRNEREYHDAVLSLALAPGAGAAEAALAAFASLALKGVQAEEDAHLARLLRGTTEPRLRNLAAAMVGRRSRLATLFHAAAPAEEIRALIARIEASERELGDLSRAYGAGLQARGTRVEAVQARLAPGEALLELRSYQRNDFAAARLDEWRWAGLLVTRDASRVLDLGSVAALAPALAALAADPRTQEAARAAFDQLLAPVLPGLSRLYVAPDGALQLLPFAALLAPDGRRVAEVVDVRVLLTGRDLLRPRPERPARGLLALGGVDFDAVGGAAAQPTVLAELAATDTLRSATAGALGHGFRFLPGSAREVAEIAALYRAARPGESVDLLTGAAASEAALANRPAPRVLHLATHGFYLPATVDEDRPLLLSGIALAGANRALAATGQDGILYAIEAQDLDLEGTELVVLSACETAQGQVEYGEGVAGLVRALRTAGARHVLATLRPVEDQAALAFMRRFYRHYLAQATPDPAAALRAAQIEAMREAGEAGGPDRGLGRPGGGGDAVWAQFVLFGG